MLYKFAVCSVMIKLCIEMTSGFELRDSPFIQIAASYKLSRVLVFENISVLSVSLSLGFISLLYILFTDVPVK